MLQGLGEAGVDGRELPGPRLDLLLEIRVRLLELPRRTVELVTERFELVAGPDLYAVAEVAGADPRRALLEHADRRDHSPGQENAGQHREPEAQHEDDGAPDDRSPERSVGCGGGALDEDEPPEGSNRGVGRQHPPAPETVGDHGHRSARPG